MIHSSIIDILTGRPYASQHGPRRRPRGLLRTVLVQLCLRKPNHILRLLIALQDGAKSADEAVTHLISHNKFK